jgi:hypothetical protein
MANERPIPDGVADASVISYTGGKRNFPQRLIRQWPELEGPEHDEQ